MCLQQLLNRNIEGSAHTSASRSILYSAGRCRNTSEYARSVFQLRMVDILICPTWSIPSSLVAGVSPWGLAKHSQQAVVHKHLVLGSTDTGYLVSTQDPEIIFWGDFEAFWLRLFSCHCHRRAQLYHFLQVNVFYFAQVLVLEKNPARWASVCVFWMKCFTLGTVRRLRKGSFPGWEQTITMGMVREPSLISLYVYMLKHV